MMLRPRTPALPSSVAEAAARPVPLSVIKGLGLPEREVKHLIATGSLRRVLKGLYVDALVPDTVDLRIQALGIVVPEHAVVCDRHAGWMLGAEMILAPGEHLHARPLRVLRRRGHAPLRNGLVDAGERDLSDRDITRVGGLLVTTPLRTMHDLGMVRWPSEALAGMNALFRTGLVDHDELLEGVPQFKGRRWVSTLRAVAPLVHGRCESPPEDILWLRCLEAGIELEPQVEVWDRLDLVGRFDLADRRLKLIVEYDGEEWHSSPDQLERDRRRRDAARALGWTVVVLRREDLFTQTSRAEELIRAGLRLARERAGLPAY